ncbi:peptidylprolyl isomerase [Fibrella aquatica]|uniref:peptidylprolyl isomerase n=1 Tax=Fibrella aquatica TaxID=3242487 RepID=UPI0035228F55
MRLPASNSLFLRFSPPSFGTPITRRLTSSALLLLFVAACKTSAPVATTTPAAPPVPVVLTLGGAQTGNKVFTSDEFFDSFTKNQLSADSSQRTDIRSYLDLYTNLKLKVLAAEQAGRDTTEAFREEMATYRKQLAQTYLTDKALVEQLTSEAYQRMQQEVRASHVLIPVAEEATPADTLAAYQQALAVRGRLLSGEPFATVAKEVSKDPTVAQNGGDLGYFSVFRTVYPFENAAYRTPVGSLSAPVRTRFGYHLIRVADRRPSRGKVQVAHILVRLSPSAEPNAVAAAKARIDEAYAKLTAGEAFETLARTYSDDAQSKNTGGKLPSFATGQMVPALEEAAFALTAPGSYSPPVRTNYGWHVLKLIQRTPIEPFAELAPAIRQKVVTDSRAEVIRQATVQRLSRDYKVVENEAAKQVALAKADSSLLQGRWRIPAETDPSATQPLLTIEGTGGYSTTVPIGKFFTYVQQKQLPRTETGLTPNRVMQRLYSRFIDDQLLVAEEANLDKKYPEFRNLLNEVRDGVLLSQVMEATVWERSLTDSLGQKQFFEQNKARYTYPERAVATIIEAPSETLLNEVKTRLATSPYALKRSAPTLQFEPNQTALSATNRDAMYDILVTMVKNPAYILDVKASHAANEKDSTSAGRLRSVVTYLTSNGIQLARINENDLQGARDDARRVTFTYLTTSKQDVARVVSGTATEGVTITEGIFAKGQNAYLDERPWQSGTTTFTNGNRVVSIAISRIDPPRPRTFAEARGTVINEYQTYLEQQFLAELRQKYPVQVNEEELKRLLK